MSPSDRIPATSVILSLPEEILDQICEEMARLKNDSAPTLRSWILTCRAFVDSGERAQYKAPLRSSAQSFSVHSAQTLLRTLRVRPDLDRYLKSYEHLATATKRLLNSAIEENQDRIGGRGLVFDPFDWQLSIIRISPRVEVLSICLDDRSARELGTALGMMGPPQKMVIRLAPFVHKPASVFRTFLEASGATEIRPLELESLGLTVPESVIWANEARGHVWQPYAATHLHLDITGGYLFDVYAFLPVVNLGLVSLHLNVSGATHSPDILDLLFHSFHGIGPFVTDFQCVIKRSSAPLGVLQLFDPKIVFPEGAFLFPCPTVRKFTLPDGRDMTLEMLDHLVTTSPNLEHLDLSGTSWSAPSSASPSSPSLDTQVRRSLARLNRLRHAILGYYPGDLSAGDETSEASGGGAAENGAEIVWQREGEVHDEAE